MMTCLRNKLFTNHVTSYHDIDDYMITITETKLLNLKIKKTICIIKKLKY